MGQLVETYLNETNIIMPVPEALCFRVVRPSVRPKPEIPSFHLYMGPLVHPINRDRFTACPSVRPERFLGICWRTHGGNGLKLCMLMYLHHLQRWLDYGHNLLIFLILMLFWLSETGQIWGFWSISGERMGVNVEGERRHISDALRRVLSSFTNIIICSQNTLIFISRKWIWFYSNALSWMKNNVFWFKFPDGASPVRAWRRIGDKLLPGPTTIDG